MDNQKVLEKAIAKAIEGGWDGKLNEDLDYWEEDHKAWFDGGLGDFGGHVYPEDVWAQLIFNHDFAKALWGGDEVMASCELREEIDGELLAAQGFVLRDSAWKLHLQQMVIAEDPIKYLGENI